MKIQISKRKYLGNRPIIALSTGILLAFLAWANFAEVDQISRALGQAIPSGRVQLIQSADGGVISELRVREGDLVTRGQTLVLLDPARVSAALTEGQSKLASLEAQVVRIEAELYDRPLAFPPEVLTHTMVVQNQRALFSKRRQSLSSEIQSMQNVRALISQELQMNLPLLKSGDVSRSEIIRLQRQQADIDSQIANRRGRYSQELQTEYTKTQDELLTAKQLVAQRQESLAYTKILSPTDGIIKNVRFTTVGAVLRPGDEVLQIVPTNDDLIIEAQVLPADIASIRAGQAAGVKFDAYDSSIYGAASGIVTYISPDTLSEQKPEGEAKTYYRVHVKVDTSTMHVRKQGEKVVIQPGMLATVEIKTGHRTVLRYLFKPIMQTFSESMSER